MTHPDLIAFDLDGTLLDSRSEVSPRAADAIGALTGAGATVILATGRPPRWTHRYVAALGLEHALVYNGASRYHAPTESSEHHHQLSADEARAVIARLRAHLPQALLGMETHHGWYLDRGLEALRRANPNRLAGPGPDGVGAVEGFVRDAVIKVFARDAGRDAASMAEAIEGLDVYTTWSNAGLLEVMHPAVNKRDALARLAASLSIPQERVAFFGDERNDIEALRWAGHGVAVANASAGARAAADEVTSSNDEDGVARVLERWL